ncbi:MAG: hypothetical protein AABN95_05150 [Acidobacteriota bacterium]
MKAAPAREKSEPARSQKREFKNTPLNFIEKERLHRLAIRFQEIIYARNQAEKDASKKMRSDVEDVDFMRAGLLRLEAIRSADEFYEWIVKGRNRE